MVSRPGRSDKDLTLRDPPWQHKLTVTISYTPVITVKHLFVLLYIEEVFADKQETSASNRALSCGRCGVFSICGDTKASPSAPFKLGLNRSGFFGGSNGHGNISSPSICSVERLTCFSANMGDSAAEKGEEGGINFE